MIKLIACLSVLIIIFACNNAQKLNSTSMINNHLAKDEVKEGWRLLFDGKSTKGWHVYGGGEIEKAWRVNEDGLLYFDHAMKRESHRKSGYSIVTDEEFDNFHLKLEWRISKNGNSGILFYVHEDTARFKENYETGPEMQILDNNGHPDAKIHKHRAGDLYDLIASNKEAVKPAMEWNSVEIKCIDGKLDFYLNGENVVSTTMWDDNWRNMISKSKFKDWPDFGIYKRGAISLQDHGNLVEFRNIKIKTL